MQQVILTALGIGGATVLGSLIGFAVKRIPHRFNDIILSFAAGVMLAASVLGLILPAVESGGRHGGLIAGAGILCGAFFLNLIDRLVPHMHNIAGIDREGQRDNIQQLNKILLFVMAIGIHNLPEGIAAGVSFGTGNTADAFTVAAGIALQNVPEGMIIIAPMLAAGISRRRTFLIALATGLIEVGGRCLATSPCRWRRFAALYAGVRGWYDALCHQPRHDPETHSHGYERGATYALLVGFIVMLVMDFYIG